MPLDNTNRILPPHQRNDVTPIDVQAQLNALAMELDPIAWEEMPETKKAEWRKYRKELLALHQQKELPPNAKLPVKPNK